MNRRPISAPATPLGTTPRLSVWLSALFAAGALEIFTLAQAPTLEPPPKKDPAATTETPLPVEKTTEPSDEPDFIGPPLPPALISDPLPLPDTQLLLMPVAPSASRRIPPLATGQTSMSEAQIVDYEELDPVTLRPKPKPYTFVVPGFYGAAPQTFVNGEGPLSGPRFRARANIAIGWDSNVNRATKNDIGGEIESAYSTLGAYASVQSAKRMQLLLLETTIGADHYWTPKETNYNLDLGLTYQRIFVAPSTLTANLRLAYLSQPDYSQVNISNPSVNEVEGDSSYFIFDTKVDYSYRWTPQLSTRTTFAANSILYQGSRETDNFLSLTLGNEFRFRSGRFTWIGEVRYEALDYLNQRDRNSRTLALLAGAEWRLGKWISASTRFGESFRSFKQGDDAVNPQAEFAILFRPDAQNSFNLNARFGMEANSDFGDDSQIIRFGFGYRRVFTSRLNGSIGVGYVRTDTQGESGESSEILDGNLSLTYQLTRRISLSTGISATRSTSSTGLTDYDQCRATFSGNFEF